MSRKLMAATAALAMVFSTTAFAQDATTPNAPMPPSSTTDSTPDASSPNAPVQSSDEGPVSPGDQAGTPVAAVWTPTVPEIAIAGAVAVAAVICIATCGGSGNNTTTTTTTSPK